MHFNEGEKFHIYQLINRDFEFEIQIYLKLLHNNNDLILY